MFAGCSSITNLNLSNWDTSNVTNMESVFAWCSSLEKLDLSGWNNANVTTMNSMFRLIGASVTNCDLYIQNINLNNNIDYTDILAFAKISNIYVNSSEMAQIIYSNITTAKIFYRNGTEWVEYIP